jgi:hypothetical protein
MATHSGGSGGEPGENGNGIRGLPTAVVEDLLACNRRRQLLWCLHQRGEPVAVDDLATILVASETDTDPTRVTADRRRSMREEIYQEHLPKLTATGAVEFDSMRGTVTFAGDATLKTRMQRLAESENR